MTLVVGCFPGACSTYCNLFVMLMIFIFPRCGKVCFVIRLHVMASKSIMRAVNIRCRRCISH